MQVQEARRILGLDHDVALDPAAVRAAYRAMVRQAHPDVNDRPDAAERTVRLTQAYDLLTAASRTDPGSDRSTGSAARSTQPPRTADDNPPRRRQRRAPAPTPGSRIDVTLLDDGSISVAAPSEETLALVLDAAHALGEISYLDHSAALVEVIVEFVEAPTSSVLFSLQGRGDGTTELFCTVEPLSGGDAPPADAVARLVAATLAEQQVQDR